MKLKAKLLRAGLLLIVGLLPNTLRAQASLFVSNVPGYPGATVSVPVSLRQPAGGGGGGAV
jgi:hypothetical protein